MTQDIHFVKGEIFHRKEDDYVEFKALTSKSPAKTIINYAEEYILGSLNLQEKLDLYFGIDNSGIIQGVTLSRDNEDEIMRGIPVKLKTTNPHIPYEYYHTNIFPVLNEKNNPIENLYIVHIHLLKIEGRDWYRTSGGSIYFKKGSNNMKLNEEQFEVEKEARRQKFLRKDAEKYDKELNKSPNNLEVLQKRADIAYYMHDITAMKEMYERMLTISPTSPNLRIKYAQAMVNPEDGISILDDAIQLGINSPSILKNKGLSLQSLKRWDESYQSYKQAYDKNTDDYTILTQMGIVLKKSGRYKESIQHFNEALKKAPNYRLAKYEKKLAYYEMFKGGIGT